MTTLNYGIDLTSGIAKKVIHASRNLLSEFPNDTKITFRFQTRLCDDDKTVLDDNRKECKPMELIIGKKFKMEVWETCLKSMRVGEVASFICDASLCICYPMVAKTLREIKSGKAPVHSHCCGMSIKHHGVGFADLDKLIDTPQPLEFIFELLTVEEPGGYIKETWAMGEDEQLAEIPKLKLEGNVLFNKSQYYEAAIKYDQALKILDQFALKEKPGSDEYLEFDNKKIPYFLNTCQCYLFLKEYYLAIEQATEVLTRDPDNVKALYRRAKANVGAWNPKEARLDFERALSLDPLLKITIAKELRLLDDLVKEKMVTEKFLLQGKLFA